MKFVVNYQDTIQTLICAKDRLIFEDHSILYDHIRSWGESPRGWVFCLDSDDPNDTSSHKVVGSYCPEKISKFVMARCTAIAKARKRSEPPQSVSRIMGRTYAELTEG
jgi:hypothetical protein